VPTNAQAKRRTQPSAAQAPAIQLRASAKVSSACVAQRPGARAPLAPRARTAPTATPPHTRPRLTHATPTPAAPRSADAAKGGAGAPAPAPAAAAAAAREETEQDQLSKGPLSLLMRSVRHNTQVLINLRNNHKLLGRVRAFDRHCNMVLEQVKEVWSEVPPGGKKSRPIPRDRVISKMFLRGAFRGAVRALRRGAAQLFTLLLPSLFPFAFIAGDSVIVVVSAENRGK